MPGRQRRSGEQRATIESKTSRCESVQVMFSHHEAACTTSAAAANLSRGLNFMSTSHAVHPVASDAPELDDVFALYRTHSGTLGFLPRGAFEQFASEGHVLCVRIDGSLAGYLAYRVANSAIVLVHLCVSRDHRGCGVARALMDTLLHAEADMSTVRLSCRDDYVLRTRWTLQNT